MGVTASKASVHGMCDASVNEEAGLERKDCMVCGIELSWMMLRCFAASAVTGKREAECDAIKSTSLYS